jgi:uncharacterized protein (TIGR03435 family)
MRRLALALVFALAMIAMVVTLATSQTPAQKPSFEVASIKPNTSGSRSTSSGFQGCRFVANNATLKMMVVFTYRLPSGQVLPYDRVIGSPKWMDTDHFDVEAKAAGDADSVALQHFLLMVQALLEDRFQLKVHWEKRELPTYDLVVAKDGPKLKKSDVQPNHVL